MSGKSGDIPADVAEAWQELCEKDDRTSPAEHPDMCLITRDELLGYMSLANAEGERAGIERAAKVCDDSFRDGSLTRTYECETADELAARIRALPTTAETGEEA